MAIANNPRADASRNRERLLATAEVVFAEHGPAVPLELVAEAAGVGRATLYRNFPDRAALAEALLFRALDVLEERARTIPDGPEKFFSLLAWIADNVIGQSALFELWRVINRDSPASHAGQERLQIVFARPLAEAIGARACRRDLRLDELPLLVTMIGAALRGRDRAERQLLARRALMLLELGLRPSS